MEIYYLFALFLKPVARAKRIAYLLSSSFFNFSEGLPPCFGLNSCERKWMCSVRSKPMKKPGVRSSVNWPTAFRVWSQESCQQQPSGLRVLRVKRVGQRHLLQQKDTKVMSACCGQKCLGVHAPKILRWSFCWVHHLKKDSKVESHFECQSTSFVVSIYATFNFPSFGWVTIINQTCLFKLQALKSTTNAVTSMTSNVTPGSWHSRTVANCMSIACHLESSKDSAPKLSSTRINTFSWRYESSSSKNQRIT